MKNLIKIFILITLSLGLFSSSEALDIFTLKPPVAIYVAPNGSDSNDGLTTSTPKLNMSAALALIQKNPTGTSFIHVASGTHTWTGVNSAAIFYDKNVSGDDAVIILGYVNSTPNSFTNASSDSGTSSGSNTNSYGTDGGTNEGFTYFYDTAKAWTTNQWSTKFLRITGGTGLVGSSSFSNTVNWYMILGNTGTRLNILGKYAGAVPDATTTYAIYDLNNSPNITVGANSYCISADKARGLVVLFIKCLEPTSKSLSIIDSDNITIGASHIVGGLSWVSRSRKISIGRTYLQTTSSRNQGIGFYNQTDASMDRVYIDGYIGQAFYSNYSNIGLSNALIYSASTSPADDGMAMNTGFYADTGSQVSVEDSKILGRNSTAFQSWAILATWGTHVQLQKNVLIQCLGATNTYGVTINYSSTTETLVEPSLIKNCWRGIEITNNSVWNEVATMYYSGTGAGGDEYFDENVENLTQSLSCASGSITPNVAQGWNINVTPALTGTCTVNAPFNMMAGARITLQFTQDGTGGRAVTWNSVYKNSFRATGNNAGKTVYIPFQYDGTNWLQDGPQRGWY